MSTAFVPIFEKEGNRLFVLSKDFKADTSWDATTIGFGAMFVECILLGMEFKREVLEIDLKCTPHVPAKIKNVSVAVISGPLFEEYANAQQKSNG